MNVDPLVQSKSEIRFLPRIGAGCVWPPSVLAERMISVAWLIMTELLAYVEDVDSASESLELLEIARIRLGELLVVMDSCLSGGARPDEVHHLALLLEYGLADIADLSGPEVVDALGLAEGADPAIGPSRVHSFLEALLAAFPGELTNALLPENQGRVIRALRMWEKACAAAGTDAAFLLPMMRAL